MPNRRTVQRAKADLRAGKSPSTAAGEFVHEEIEHVRAGKHGARSSKQAIAIGLSKARRAGIPLPPPSAKRTSKRTQQNAERDSASGKDERKTRAPSARRSRATRNALKREPTAAGSHRALSRHARSAAKHSSRPAAR